MIPITDLLTKKPVQASAPCRIDSGGTWDIKALALPLEAVNPTTVNIALSLRTRAVLHPFEEGKVKIRSTGFDHPETGFIDRLPFDTRFGLFFAAVSFFGFHGVEIRIDSESPIRSAMGGSSTALVALIKALSKVSVMVSGKGYVRREILHLAYHLEDGVSGGNCGIQDQAAAVYGGVHQWEWCYRNRSAPLRKIPLLDPEGRKALSRRLLIIYSGKRHTSSETNLRWIRDFLSGSTRARWIRANQTVRRFGRAVHQGDWKLAAALLREEMSIRREVTPGAITPFTEELIEQAEEVGCGARFAGAGAGGSLWAVGSLKNIERLRERWSASAERVKGARLLDCRVDSAGVR